MSQITATARATRAAQVGQAIYAWAWFRDPRVYRELPSSGGGSSSFSVIGLRHVRAGHVNKHGAAIVVAVLAG